MIHYYWANKFVSSTFKSIYYSFVLSRDLFIVLLAFTLLFGQIGLTVYGGIVESDLLRHYQEKFAIRMDIAKAYYNFNDNLLS